MLIRHAGEMTWRPPAATAFDDEIALQLLLQGSPEILPGGHPSPLVVSRELYIPDTGLVDIVTVALDGTIRLIECKLRANPEIRRAVIGQVLAYASGLWKLKYAEFDAAFQARNGESLLERATTLAQEASVEFDGGEFTRAVAANLETGSFHLVIAVDKITDELKRTVEYLNEHTLTQVSVLALEVIYVRDGDVEILVPSIYGEEAVRRKEAGGVNNWSENSFMNSLQEFVPQPQRDRMLEVIAHAREHPSPTAFYWGTGRFYWGQGRYPSCGAWFKIAGEAVAVWTIYLDPQRSVFSFNFEWMARRSVPVDAMERVAGAMRPLPGVFALYADLAEREYRKRPSLPVRSLFADERAPKVITAAVDQLVSWAT